MKWYVADYEESGINLMLAEDDTDAIEKGLENEMELGILMSIWEINDENERTRLIY